MSRKALVSFLFVTGSSLAHAAPMTFDVVGVGDPNNTATVTFEYDQSIATLIIDIANTSAMHDPRLTSFAFNAPAGVTGISTFSGPSGWAGVFDANDIDTLGQFGFFDVAGLTGANFNGGDPLDGVPPGSSFHFEIVVTGSGLGALTEASFLSEFSHDPAGPPVEDVQYFITRFQQTGPAGTESDVAIPDGDPSPIPEPASVLLLMAGVSAMAAARKRQKRS